MMGDYSADPLLEYSVTHTAGSWILTLRAEMPVGAEALWPWITDPELVRKWSPAVPDRVLQSIGPARASEAPGDPTVDAEVLELRPPLLLVQRWGPGILRWELQDTESGGDLRLANSLDDESMLAPTAAGWHVCFAVLAANCGGSPTPRVVGQDALQHGWAELNTRYAKALATR